jgi:hypothetical protein
MLSQELYIEVRRLGQRTRTLVLTLVRHTAFLVQIISHPRSQLNSAISSEVEEKKVYRSITVLHVQASSFVDDLRDLVVTSHQGFSSLSASIQQHVATWAATQDSLPGQLSSAMHEVLVRYEADASARQDDLAQQWESERAANREWTTNATAAFAASVAEHSMVCVLRSLPVRVLTSSRPRRR